MKGVKTEKTCIYNKIDPRDPLATDNVVCDRKNHHHHQYNLGTRSDFRFFRRKFRRENWPHVYSNS